MSRPRHRPLRASISIAVTALVVLLAATTGAAGAGAQPVPGDDSTGRAAAAAATAGVNAAAAAGTATSAPAPVELHLISTSPVAPPAQSTDTTVTVLVTVTNNTDTALQQLQLRAVRDSPIIRPSALNTMLGHPTPPADSTLTQTLPTTRYPNPIAAHASAQLRYEFPASTIRQSGGVCLCQSGIYPIDISAFAATGAASTVRSVAWAQTYLVSVTSAPATEQVSWLWPLIDRPHRLADTGPFLDDALAAEVAPGGRLDRSLQVLEQVGATAKITAVIDPELIDEIEQMTTGYRVQQGTSTVAGTGGPAAVAWLARLRNVLATIPLAFTPYGDPAVDAATTAKLSWSVDLPATMAARITLALGRPINRTDSALAWPPGETLTPAALSTLADQGSSTIVVDDATLPGGRSSTAPLPAVANVAVAATATRAATTVRALVTSSALEQQVDGLLGATPAASNEAGLPALLAGLALRTLQDGASPSFVVLTPSRYVDTSPAVAAALITATSQSSWATPIAAGVAASTLTPADHGALTAAEPQRGGGNDTLIAQAKTLTTFATEFRSALDATAANTLLAGYSTSAQLCLSAGWSTDPSGAAAVNSQLTTQRTQLANQVQIVRPSNGSYSLASSSAPLLVTVVNNLPVPVTVRLAISTVGGVAGFRTDDAGPQVIAANSRRTIKLQAHVARSGHFRVQAELLMPAGGSFGPVLPLSIYSSALGTIGVIITVVAGVVLLLALIYRFARRWRHHRELIRRMMAEEQRVLTGTRR